MYTEECDYTKAGIYMRILGGERESWRMKLEAIPMKTAKKILGCSKTASNTALRTELRMHSPKTETHGN